jgi:cell wall-associated NlpC family hydrolase
MLVTVGLVALIVAPVLAGAVSVAALLHAGAGAVDIAVTPDHPAAGIPPPMLAAYQRAATACPGLSWTVLAAIGTVESANGQSVLPGVRSGRNQAGAAGPMQFEPATFARYAWPVPAGGASPPSPYDPLDAAYAAARLLCASGAGTGSAAALDQAIFAYNHSHAYVDRVQAVSASLAVAVASAATAAPAAARVAVSFALAQIGTPYQWGAESAGLAFDCSGLAQAAWAAAGVPLPRVAQDQFDAGPLVPPAETLQPGDLAFFGPSGGGVTHVGMVVDPAGRMVDAPHSGAVVRVEPFPLTVGAGWGTDVYLGATRPGQR